MSNYAAGKKQGLIKMNQRIQKIKIKMQKDQD